MKILLQRKEDGLFYAPDGHWTANPEEAKDWETSSDIVFFCHYRHLDCSGYQVLLKFKDATKWDISLAL